MTRGAKARKLAEDRAQRKYRNTLAQMRRAERLLTRVVEADRAERAAGRSTWQPATLSDKQFEHVNAARWRLASAFRRK